MQAKKKRGNAVLTVVFTLLSVAYVCPILIVLINSFKK